MFLSMTNEPRPYVLDHDRNSDTPTTWWLTPRTAEHTQTYLARLEREAKRSAGQPVTAAAAALTKIHRDEVLAALHHVDNAEKEGDSVDEADALGRIVAGMDFFTLQELILAAQQSSRLGEPAKNF